MTDELTAAPVDGVATGPGLFGFEGKAAADGTPLGQLPDLSGQAPHLAPYLLPFQRVIYVRDLFPQLRPDVGPRPHPSSSRALLELMGVPRLADIGRRGPGHAALPLPEHRDLPDFTLLDALVGRDALYMGLNLYESFPSLLRATLLRLAELQGVAYDSAKEEEPGRIIHWAPDPESEVARHITAVNHWQWPHYGAIDTTPLFIRGLLRVSGDDDSFLDSTYTGLDGRAHTLRHALQAAVTWLGKRLSSNAEGLLEFRMDQPRGIWNQAWKDTPESYVHADGAYANHNAGIASVETQALAYDTLRDLAGYYRRQLGDRRLSPAHAGIRAQLRSAQSGAERLKALVLDRFWIEDERGGYLALATDRDEHGHLRPLAVRTSNMGHALHLLDGDDPGLIHKRHALIETLFSGELLDRNGIRTLSSSEVRFVPFSYHCGSVWPWDNFAVAKELRAVGYPGLARNIEHRIWRIVDTLGYFAEFVPGNDASSPADLAVTRVVDVYDGERDHFSDCYRIEKPAQEIQAWTVEAVRSIKRGNRPLTPGLSLPVAAADPGRLLFEKHVLAKLAAA